MYFSYSEVHDIKEKSVGAICRHKKASVLSKASSSLKEIQWCSKAARRAAGIMNITLDIPTIYIITPTYKRPVQKAELTRLGQILQLVPNIHWILVEDETEKTTLTKNVLEKLNFPYTHLNVATPPEYKMKISDPSWFKPKGVLQRNLALKWIHDSLKLGKHHGVVYFADDDNTYDLDIFEEMRFTKKVSVWPVGLVGGLMVERPLVEDGRVVSWNTLFKPERPFPIDMAGFAINLSLLLRNPTAKFTYRVPRGFQESHLLKHLVKLDELEPKADNCSKVLVWHTRTEQPKLKQERNLIIPSDHKMEV